MLKTFRIDAAVSNNKVKYRLLCASSINCQVINVLALEMLFILYLSCSSHQFDYRRNVRAAKKVFFISVQRHCQYVSQRHKTAYTILFINELCRLRRFLKYCYFTPYLIIMFYIDFSFPLSQLFYKYITIIYKIYKEKERRRKKETSSRLIEIYCRNNMSR